MDLSSEKEKEIITVAREIFQQKGFNGTRMQEIADRAGVNKSLLHYYYRNKENLFKLVFTEIINEYIPIISTFEEEDLSWEEKVLHFSQKMIEFVEKGSMLFLLREIKRKPELISKREKRQPENRIVKYFQQLIDEGKIKNIDPKLLYIFIISLCCYPSINDNVFKVALRLNEKEYRAFFNTYYLSVANFFINSLKTNKS